MAESASLGSRYDQSNGSTADEGGATASFTDVSGEGEYSVRQGESVSLIAKRTGHYWRTIWDHEENVALRNSRDNPNILLPGDKLHIPEIEAKSLECATGERHRFCRRGEPSKLKIVFQRQSEARAGEPYEAVIDGIHFSGSLDNEGRMILNIASDSQDGEVTIGEGDSANTYQLHLHRLNPFNHPSGLQQRLKNLGYACDVSGEIDTQTHAAIDEYEKHHHQPVSGRCDDEISDEIKREHRDG